MASFKEKQRLKDLFKQEFETHIDIFNGAISTRNGDWIVKGFIDVAKNIYTISADTKVISKIIELLLFPKMTAFAEANGFKIILCKEQNFYPDITFLDDQGHKYALDLKSTYRRNEDEVNGMTLGAFTGYFRDRTSRKNITFPYSEYVGHFVLGVIYSRTDNELDERKVHTLEDLEEIVSVIRDFDFFIQEKYRIAIDRPGSGNTKNIGSVSKIKELIAGKGPFAELGEEVFDDYWMYYTTREMARSLDLKKPAYVNLSEYIDYKRIKS